MRRKEDINDSSLPPYLHGWAYEGENSHVRTARQLVRNTHQFLYLF